MISLVAERALAELGLIRGVLSGQVPRSELTQMSTSDETIHRNKVALTLVTRLGTMLNRLNGVAKEMEGIIVALAGPNRLLMMPESPDNEEGGEKRVFGFGSARREAS